MLRKCRSESNDGGTPGEARPKGVEQDKVAGANAALASGFVQSDGNGCCGCVAVLVEIDDDFVERNAKALGQSDDYPPVRLMRNHKRNFLDRYAGILQRLPADFFHGANGDFEDFLS